MAIGNKIPCVMTVAGSDSGAGAGIQADILTIAANGAYACSAIAALTAQNPDGVSMITDCPPEMLSAQLEAVNSYYKPKAAKTGMLFNARLIERAADFFSSNRRIRLVVDPVMISTSGAKLLLDDAAEALVNKLLPLAELVTPNLDEAAAILGVASIVDIQKSAKELSQKLGVSVLLKGGHLKSDALQDVLYTRDGKMALIKSTRIHGVDTHGSGCTLSAAIAANLAKDLSLEQSCKNAHSYLLAGMKNPISLSDANFINHFPRRR